MKIDGETPMVVMIVVACGGENSPIVVIGGVGVHTVVCTKVRG